MRKVGHVSTRFQEIAVWKSPLATEFRVAGAIHASYHENRFLTGLAWDPLAAAALLRPSGEPRSILMLGVAGGTALRVLRHLLPQAELTGIDLDGELIALAEQEMHLGKTGVKMIIADAYEWMRTNRQTFDVILDDLYLAGEEDVFRASSCDADWLGLLKRSLAPGGILAVNLVTGPGHRAKQSATRKRVASHFPCVRSLSTQDSLNEILCAGENVASGSMLSYYIPAFHDWRDRMFWRRIRVRKLR